LAVRDLPGIGISGINWGLRPEIGFQGLAGMGGLFVRGLVLEKGLFFGDKDHQVRPYLTLTGQAGIFGIILHVGQQVPLVFRHLAQTFVPPPDMDMAGGTGAVTAAVVVDLHVVVESGIEQNRAF